MNRSSLITGVAVLALASANAEARTSAVRIDPPHWWTGMADTSLQLQVFAPGIKNDKLEISYPGGGVRLDSVVRLDGSPDWQYVYLTVSPEAKPGKLKLTWEGKEKYKAEYELRGRGPLKGARGFSSADLLYMLMPDRFADGDPSNNIDRSMKHPVGADRTDLNVRHGGDLAGLENHIDYIDSLGVTAVWVSPVLENDMPYGSYHGYATTDYYRIDPRFGTNEDYSRLIAKLHERGIKTVMDMIFNHSGSGHPWFENRPSSDWYNFSDGYQQTNHRLSTINDRYASDYDREMTTSGWFVREMPDLNQKNVHLMKYLTQNSIWWIEEAGIDGIRMDTYPYADKMAMRRWIDDVKRQYPDFNIVGECWFGEPALETVWQSGSRLTDEEDDSRLPVVMDFPLMIKSRNLAPYTEETDPWNGLNKIYDHLAIDRIYADPLRVLRFLDNHDTERVILEVPEDLGSWKQAVTLVLTIPGIPQLYYGTELLMAGDRKEGDGAIRRDMPGGFPGDTVNAFSREGRTDLQNEAYDFIAKVADWRKGSEAAAKGDMKHFIPNNGLYLYQRSTPDDRFIVAMNGTDDMLPVDMSRYAEVAAPGETFRDLVSGEVVELIPADGKQRIFSPRQVMILQPILE